MMRNMHGRPNEKGDIRTALPRMTDYLRSSMGVIIVALVLAALSAVMTIIGPDKIGGIATIMSDGLMTGIDLNAIARIGIFLAVIYGLSALFSFTQHYIMSVVTLKMSYRMRAELSEKINRVPQKTFNVTSQGDILSRITNDVSTLQQGLTNSLPTIISAATQFVGCLIMMFATEWRLALISLAVTFIGLLAIILIMSKSQRYFSARQKSLGELNGYVEEMYSGHEVVRISRAGRKTGAQFDRLNAAVYDANWRSQFLSGVMQPLMNVVGNISYVAVCVVGSMLALSGRIEFGVIVSFILYVRLFTSPLTQIAQGMTNLQTASASAHRIFDFLKSEEMSDESDKPAHAAVRRQNIRACAEQTHADTLLCAQAQQGLQLCKRRREGHHLGGAADAERSVRRKRLFTQQAEPGQREGKTVKQIHEISSRISKNNRAILRWNFRRDANRNHFIIVYHSLPSAASPRTRRIKNGPPQVLRRSISKAFRPAPPNSARTFGEK